MSKAYRCLHCGGHKGAEHYRIARLAGVILVAVLAVRLRLAMPSKPRSINGSVVGIESKRCGLTLAVAKG